jgi:DNA polymerase-3 subunit delta
MPAPESDALLAAARKRPAPVYLIIGEPFQTEALARELIDLLVPPQRRSLSLETYDGRSTPIGPVLDSLRTPSLLAGTKVIWVREPTLFLSGEKRGDIAAAMFAAWEEERAVEAAEKLLVLAGLAAWTQEQLTAAEWSALGTAEATALLGRRIGTREAQALEGIRAVCAERQLTVAAFRDDSGQLDQFLAAGPQANSVLIFTASAADRRKRVVKTIADAGTVIELTVARERSGALTPESVDALIERVVGRAGKRLAPAARQLIHRRAGSQAGALAAELEKLVLYAGDAPTIDEVAARDSMRDLAESWIFDFTKALAQRQAAPAITLLRALFEQGEHPLRLLAVIARELRLLLLARDCIAGSLAGAWTPRTQYTVFRDRLLPGLAESERDALGALHPYVLYQCLQNASRTSIGALQHGILALQELDVAVKSTGVDPRLRLEAFVLAMCGGARGGGGRARRSAGSQDVARSHRLDHCRPAHALTRARVHAPTHPRAHL